MREARYLSAALVSISWLIGLVTASVSAATADLPPPEVVLRKVSQRARSQHNPQPEGYYLCTKQTVTEEMDTSGRITNRKVKVGQSHSFPGGAADAQKWSNKNGVNLDEELLRRFTFTVAQRETIGGRPALLLTFIPKDPLPPIRRFQDRLLNRAIGTIWVDESDYEIVKANLALSEPVSFGILGAVESFSFSFERERDPEGKWLTRWTDTMVNARKFLKPIQLRKRVDWTSFKRLAPEREASEAPEDPEDD
jgi:hypothetical protein